GVAVAVRELEQAVGEESDLLGVGPLLRREHACRIHEACLHVARDADGETVAWKRCDVSQNLDGAETAVGGGRTADSDDDVAGAGVDRRCDQLSGPSRRGAKRIVRLLAAHEGEPGGAGHLDHGAGPVEPPARLDRIAERPGHACRAVGAAECIQRALAPVGEWQLAAAPAGRTGALRDCAGGLRRAQRASELVRRRDELHGQATYGIVWGPSGRTQTEASGP